MKSTNWLKIKEVFFQTLDLPEENREDFLASCDESVQSEIRQLLKSHYKAENFIAKPAVIEFGLNEDQLIGKQISDYQIIEEIGAGGMGKVYLAQREGFEQKFALKLIKRGMDTEAVLKRFVRERQILSRLEHPNIARLLNVGSTKEGLPFFVMEYVEGEPLTKFCDEHQSNTTERLEIFQKVCEAVKYAHQNLVVHRDIKPSNILVTADGTPKLLDFGIAKLLNTEEYEATATQARIFTPEYASPEQLNGLPITTATDVYSLGVVLYELLSGTRPFDSKGKSYQEIANLVLTQEPIRPSLVISVLRGTLKTETLENKGQKTKHEGQIRNLKGDLDNIILKSLRKEPERRYQSVPEFSEDIRRYLVGLPVTATADNTFYRFSKFVGRNKIGTAIAVLILLLSGFSVWQAVVANRERARAEQRFNEVRKLANLVLFDYHDAIEPLLGSTAVREKMVKDAIDYLDNLSAESSNDISLQSDLATAYQKVGDIQGNPYLSNLGDMDGALVSYQKSLGILQKIVSADAVDKVMQRKLAYSFNSIADINWAKGDNSQALENYKKAFEIKEKLLNQNPTDNILILELASGYYSIGQTYIKSGESNVALENFQKSLELHQKVFDTEPTNKNYNHSLATSYLKIGDLLKKDKKYSEALKYHQKAVELLETFANNKDDAVTQRILGVCLSRIVLDKMDLEDYKSAEETALKAIELQKKLVESDSQSDQYRLDLADSYYSIGDLYSRIKKIETAIEYLKKSISIFEDSLKKNPDYQETKDGLATTYELLGYILEETGRKKESQEAYKKAGK